MPVRRLLIEDAADVAYAARALAGGAVVATAFGNFYAVVTRPDAAAVRGVNLAKGRPADQVGSVTTTRPRVAGVFDWSRLPDGVGEGAVRGLMDDLWRLGPFGFRGPAAPGVPEHLSQVDGGVRTAQVIAPGYACPSNGLFDLAGDPWLYITSANRSRHLTGAAEEPAHWTARGIAADFEHVGNLVIVEHRDEAAARGRYPAFVPASVTLLSFHRAHRTPDGQVLLTVDRHGSLDVATVREHAARHGFAVTLGAGARRRLPVRSYDLARVTP
ncbi:hypothetical protein Drose_12465 [Dactylosporangium roseum]|uniref:YrdC-like domain-containing protein n=1 Tax=Dactylosporangium roseum TaxID=47989 RepID=A0ABY5ZBB4_9ACTN|nr:hypothetical protein [Dactylosporangium roseum]UWZ38959.1 hypothetical protein Drose_12465 [Dactylosporangium roseum]